MEKNLADNVARTILFATVIVFLIAPCMAAGPTKLTPNNPKWGDSVTVTYDPAVKGAKFLLGDTIYIYYELKFPGFSKNGWAKMVSKDGTFKRDITIPEEASFIFLSFVTMDSHDQNADLESMIYRRDGLPAEGAWMWQLSRDAFKTSETRYMDDFKNERKLYPENYLVYRNKWWTDAHFHKDKLKSIVGREMETLKKPGIRESPGLLWALSTGYLILDDEKASREVLQRMVRIYPKSEYTVWALREYDSQAFSKQIRGEAAEEIKRLKLELLRMDPASKILRDYILLWVAYEKDAPLDIVRPGFEAWIRDEPDNPTPNYTLAKVLLEKNEDLNGAAGLVAKALAGLVAGKWRLFGDISGGMTERALPDYYATAAAIHEKLGDFSVALAEIKAAESATKTENRPDLFVREASIWRNLGYFDKAENSFLEARRRGEKSADGKLREIYRQRHQTDEGFDAWLAEKTEKQSSAAPGDKNPAPGFEVKTLDGETLRLNELKGKVVVLNFWYIGCVPCHVEMPGLNKLVEEFKTGEVVFMAFALDDESRLREFLKKTTFNYMIVAGSSSISKQYGVSAYPTHVIINKQGLVEFTITGGSPNIQENLRPLIRGLLK